MAGYSGTPLARKLGIRESSTICTVGAPANYRELLAPLPARLRFARQVDARVDVVHLFTTARSHLAGALQSSLQRMRQDAAIWVSWPKKVPTDVTEDVVREVALPLGLVDVKVCAVDSTWSGLKLVIRKENWRLSA
jgi:Protein of unknown function (DUF3052)